MWESSEDAFYRQYGATVLQRQVIAVDSGNQVLCIEGKLARDILKIRNSELISVECESSQGLSVSFTGTESDLKEFYRIISSVRADSQGSD